MVVGNYRSCSRAFVGTLKNCSHCVSILCVLSAFFEKKRSKRTKWAHCVRSFLTYPRARSEALDHECVPIGCPLCNEGHFPTASAASPHWCRAAAPTGVYPCEEMTHKNPRMLVVYPLSTTSVCCTGVSRSIRSCERDRSIFVVIKHV